MINKLRERNQELLKKYKEDGGEQLLKQKIIERLLLNDNCFLDISIEESFAILTDLGVKNEDLTNVYQKLTMP